LKNRQQVLYWSKAADNKESFLLSICVHTERTKEGKVKRNELKKLVKNKPFGAYLKA
jgi:hypothetical protein